MWIIKQCNCINVWDKTCIKVKDLLSCQYYVKKNIRFKTPILRSDLRDYSDAYIDVKGTISAKELIVLTKSFLFADIQV